MRDTKKRAQKKRNKNGTGKLIQSRAQFFLFFRHCRLFSALMPLTRAVTLFFSNFPALSLRNRLFIYSLLHNRKYITRYFYHYFCLALWKNAKKQANFCLELFFSVERIFLNNLLHSQDICGIESQVLNKPQNCLLFRPVTFLQSTTLRIYIYDREREYQRVDFSLK